jgi:hypothetical protein
VSHISRVRDVRKIYNISVLEGKERHGFGTLIIERRILLIFILRRTFVRSQFILFRLEFNSRLF